MFRFNKKNKYFKPSLTLSLTWIFSLFGIIFFGGIVIFLFGQGFPALQNEGLSFFTKANWYYRDNQFGAGSMIYGSSIVALIAILFAAPLALGASILTSEYIKGTSRLVVKSLMELLAGIPSVVYGLLGVLFLRPFIFDVFKPFLPESGDNLLTAGLLVGIMILPTVLSLNDDAFRSVSKEEREASRALGLTRQETFFHAVFPKAFPGLIAALLLGMGRALGETIAVYLVVGRADNRLPDPWYSLKPFLQAGQTLTSKLGGSEVHLAYGDSEHWSAITALGLVLFISVIVLVLISELSLLYTKEYRS